MAHIFFKPLEKRRSTQTLLPSFGSLGNFQTPIAIYSAPVPEYAVQVPSFPGWDNSSIYPGGLLYGINFPSNPSSGYFPWSGGYGLFGLSPFSPYSQWTSPFNQFSPWNSWGFSGFMSPLWGFLGGLFGGSPWSGGGIVPDIRVLYGIFPNPSTPTNIVTYYGVTTPSVFGLW